MELRDRCEGWDGKDVALLHEVYDLCVDGRGFVASLVKAPAESDRVQVAWTWLLKRWLEEGGRLTVKQAETLFDGLAQLVPWEAQLHVLQSLHRIDLPDRSREPLEAFVRRALDSEVKFVRAWAFSGLHALAGAFEELRPEAERLMDAARDEGPASVRARIRQLRERGWPEPPEL